MKTTRAYTPLTNIYVTMKVQTCMGAIETLSFTYDRQRVHSSCQYKCVYACVLVFASTSIDLRLCTVSIAATPRALALRGGIFSLHLHDFHQHKFSESFDAHSSNAQVFVFPVTFFCPQKYTNFHSPNKSTNPRRSRC